VKAISLWQPWASLIFSPRRVKRHETRHWATFHRGPLAIHAAQKLVKDLEPDLVALLDDEFGVLWADQLPRGRMLGVATLADCRLTQSIDPDTLDRLCGDFTPGRYAWRLDNPRLFDNPPEVTGRQGFFDWYDPTVMPAQPEPARLL
jgi:hypothetical protein